MNRRQYVVSLAKRDRPWLEDIRRACDKAVANRHELSDSHIMICQKDGAKTPLVTVVRGPSSEGVRILMNAVYDVTGNAVGGDLVNA